MPKPIKIPRSMLATIEAGRLAEWQAKDDCRNFPHCLGDGNECNPECAVGNGADSQGTQWGDG